jgi:hypothetical protein
MNAYILALFQPMGIIMDHLEVADLLILRGMNKTLYRLIGSTFGSKLKKKLASRCVNVTMRSLSLEQFLTDTTWAFEGMKMNSMSINNREEDFETFPLPFSNFQLNVVKRSSFDQTYAAISTFLDRYASSIQRLWIDKFWCCLPAASGEKAFYSKLCSLTDLTIRQVYSRKGAKYCNITSQTIQDCFPETLTKNLKFLKVRSENIGKEDNSSMVMEWMSRIKSLERFRIPEMIYLDMSDSEEEEYCHDEKTLLNLFLSACLAREQLGFPTIKCLDLAGFTWTDDSIQGCKDEDWVSFQQWILKNISVRERPSLYLENVECGFFLLVSPSPGRRIARLIAEVVISLRSVNHKLMELVFPRVNSLNLFNGDEEWTMDNGQEPMTAIMFQRQNLWPNLEAINIFPNRLVKPSGVRYSDNNTIFNGWSLGFLSKKIQIFKFTSCTASIL